MAGRTRGICRCDTDGAPHRGSAAAAAGGCVVPREQQGGPGAQRADEMNGQFSSLVVGEREASLNVLQRADIVGSPPAGIQALAEHQLVPDVSAGLRSGGESA